MIKLVKKSKGKRILSFILTAILVLTTVFGAVGTVALADDVSGGTNETTSSELKLSKKAEPVEGEENTWQITLTALGKNAESTTEVVMVIDTSNSMDGDRLANVKEAAKAAADVLLTNSSTKVSLVTYNYSAEYLGVYEENGEENDKEALKNVISNLSTSAGTNINAGLYEARKRLEKSDADNKYIMLMTDGDPTRSYSINTISVDLSKYYHNGFYLKTKKRVIEPGSSEKVEITYLTNVYDYEVTSLDYNYSIGFDPYNMSNESSNYTLYRAIPEGQNTYNGYTINYAEIHDCCTKAAYYEANLIKNSGIPIYGIGVGFDNMPEVLENISSGAGYAYNAQDDPESIKNVFVDVVGLIRNAAENAVVTDPMGTEFNIVGDATNTSDVTPSQGTISYDEATDTISWNAGTIVEGVTATLTYKVTVDPELFNTMSEDEEYDTNKRTYITYINNQGEAATQDFDIPKVQITKPSLNVRMVEVDDNGAVVQTFSDKYIDVYGNYVDEKTEAAVNVERTITAEEIYEDENDRYDLVGIDVNGVTTTDKTVSVTPTIKKATNKVVIKYKKKTQADVTIKYYKDSINENNKIGADLVLENQTVGTDIELTDKQINNYLPEGYAEPGSVSGATEVSSKSEENIVYVVYSTKADVGYIIEYYKDSTDGEPFEKDEDNSATFETTVTITADEINAKQPDGYKAGTVVGDDTITISANKDENVFKVLYTKDSFDYVIKYYVDEIVEDEESPNYLGVSDTRSAEFGSTISGLTSEDLNAKKPEGYKDGVIKTATLTITSNEANNVIKVLYTKDSFDYVIKYYVDEIKDDEDHYLGESTTRSAEFGSTISELTSEDLNDKKPEPVAGYQDGTTNNLPLVITTDATANVIKVLYLREVIGYDILYYVDEVSGDPIQTVSVDASFGDAIDVSDALNAYKPEAGYLDGEVQPGSATEVTEVRDNNKVIILYKKGSYPYTVKYYKDEIDEEGNNLLGTEEHDPEEFGTVINAAGVNVTSFKPDGYEDGIVVSGDLTITANVEENVINVVYSTKSDVDYTIEYYKQVYVEGTDTIKEEMIVDPITGTAKFETPIEYIQSNGTTRFATTGETDKLTVDIGVYLETGYKTEVLVTGPEGDKLGLEDNTIKIVYQIEKYTITTEYYFDDEIDDSKTTTTDQYYDTTIDEVTPEEIAGYEVDRIEYPDSDTLTDDVTIKVYYKKIVEPEIAADEDEVLPPTPELEPEIAADEEIVEEVAADITQTGDTNNMIIYFIAIMLSAGCLAITGNKYFKKED
ncbi:VWA domain-containing protein [Lachnospira pectinoschiza]|uniref:von Willebrand factor type A domain-containing protein n=1 Tax=Lachnospira pectinoschiza TaxID=28052 RepID=A0A1G9U080_9FIRM|nr:VWA domain-containing protein [Lachnospira pectinoschiza]SDM53336.1 von Willebrand factor type A domain-containing protein [Lachnospira pectinoschiza]